MSSRPPIRASTRCRATLPHRDDQATLVTLGVDPQRPAMYGPHRRPCGAIPFIRAQGSTATCHQPGNYEFDSRPLDITGTAPSTPIRAAATTAQWDRPQNRKGPPTSTSARAGLPDPRGRPLPAASWIGHTAEGLTPRTRVQHPGMHRGVAGRQRWPGGGDPTVVSRQRVVFRLRNGWLFVRDARRPTRLRRVDWDV